MIRHRKVRLMLYEYLSEELSPSDRASVEAHVASCHACRRELEIMRSMLGMLSVSWVPPSDERAGDFWNALPDAILRKVRAQKPKRGNVFVEAVEWMEDLFVLHPRYTLAATGIVAAFLVVFALWTFHTPGHRETEFTMAPSATVQETATGQPAITPERVRQYFRRSKALLVGVVNLQPDRPLPIDFSKERRVSQDLVREARYLKQQPMDPRARRLMDDMERIFIELSNVEGHGDPSTVDIVQSGIHQENLLFKIRIAEAMYDPASFVYAGAPR